MHSRRHSLLRHAGVTCAAILALFAAILGQSDAEREALRKLGPGFVVYHADDAILRSVFDGQGGVTTENLAPANGGWPLPTVSHDGSYIVYRECDDLYCDVWMMDADGSNKRKISKAPQKYLNYLRCSSNSPTLCYNGGETINVSWWAAPGVFIMDLEGNATKIYEASNMTDYLDCSGDMLTFRLNRSDVVLCDMAGKTTKIRQGCGQTLSPGGDKLLINNTSHNGFYIYTRSGDNWSKTAEQSLGGAYHRFKWSNKEEWALLMGGQAGDRDATAFNTVTFEKIKVTFTNGTIANGTMYLGPHGQTRGRISRRSARSRTSAARGGALRLYDLRGALIGTIRPGTTHRSAPGAVLVRTTDGHVTRTHGSLTR